MAAFHSVSFIFQVLVVDLWIYSSALYRIKLVTFEFKYSTGWNQALNGLKLTKESFLGARSNLGIVGERKLGRWDVKMECAGRRTTPGEMSF